MNIDGGESLQSTKVKLEDVLVRGLQFTNVYLCQVGRSMTANRPSWASTFQIVEVDLSDKECAHWGPSITVNYRSVNTSVLVES
jgi:hypothetical protein